MSEVSLVDLYRIGSSSFPQPQKLDTIVDSGEREFWKVIGQVDSELSQTMSTPMSKLFAADS